MKKKDLFLVFVMGVDEVVPSIHVSNVPLDSIILVHIRLSGI